MEFGITMFVTDQSIGPAELARAVEERGFDSLWLPEHSHIPVSRETPWGGVKGAPALPGRYRRTLDPFLALAAAASVTTRIRLGTAITLVAQRDPIWLAKEVATLDLLSEGRFIFGIGYGWNKEEMAHHGVAYPLRRELVREKVLMMKELWTQEEASFEGDLVRLEASWAWPKPVTQPHPPILLGSAAGPKTVAALVEYCDGWIPLGRHSLEKLGVLRRALEIAGRDPANFLLTYCGAKPTRPFLDQLANLDFDRVVFSIDPGPAKQVVSELDRLVDLVEAYHSPIEE